MCFEEMAQELVEATSRLIGGRVINIMNTEGVIISSTEKRRIGTVHAGACEVIRTGRSVAIEKEAVGRYPGAREGYNVPVCSGGRIIAVVGIFGNPEEVRETASLLAVYTAKYFEQSAVAQQQQVSVELRTRYLHLLLALSPSDEGMLESLSSALCIRQEFPVRVFVLYLSGADRDALSGQQKLNRAAENLLFHRLIRGECDVWGTVDNSLVLVKSGMTGDEDQYADQVCRCIRDGLEEPFQLCIGSLCSSAKSIKQSYEEAAALVAENAEISDITKVSCKFRYLMRNTCVRESHHVDEMYGALKAAFSGRELEVFLDTAACYYQEGGSVSRAAARLHVHKNTLQYRLHRIWETLGLDDSSAFIREYFLRLCLLRHEKDR
jgi:sugar diacid utilization regulator